VKNQSARLVSVVVPAYNEIENLPELYRQQFDRLDESFELLVVDDGSTDETLDWLRTTCQRDGRVKFVSFSRNFGHQAAVTAGMQRATGELLVIMDADLQDPPQAIPAMLQRWREGYQVVFGRRSQKRCRSAKPCSSFRCADPPQWRRFLPDGSDCGRYPEQAAGAQSLCAWLTRLGRVSRYGIAFLSPAALWRKTKVTFSSLSV
jgi:glycosyltransferase involved in cell wall biosynthesis